MSPAPPLPQPLWDALHPEAREFVAAMQRRINALEATIRELQARLAQDSTNSSKPPSADPPHLKRRPPKPPSGRRRGGQPGHGRHSREMVPPEGLTAVVQCRPAACGGCGRDLCGDDPDPARHQVAELPEVRPEVVEYRLHRLTCTGCGAATRGELPAGVPRGGFGPRLRATIALLGGAYRLSKRHARAVLRDLLGLSVSLGSVAKAQRQVAEALDGPVQELAAHVRESAAAGVDETGWRQAGRRAWLWVAVTPGATLFRIDHSRGADALHALVGDPVGPAITCDRFPTYGRAPVRQICWAHLRRDFQAMIDRDVGGREVGEALLQLSGRVFEWWRRMGRGSISRPTLRGYVAGLRPLVRSALSRGVACTCPRTARVCRKLLRAESCLWTFARVAGVEPHNNAAERALRHAVIWRKTSHGTDSPRGGRFVERVLSSVATCRQQGRDVLAYLTACARAHLAGTPAPSMLG